METIAQRLKYAIEISGKKKIQISRETGIDKGSISNYVNGRYEPKSGAIHKLAKSLNVSESWLLGYDVPMSREYSSDIVESSKGKGTTQNESSLSPEQRALLSAVSELPVDDLKKALEYVELLRLKRNS